jgi:hypothetical protein
MLANAIDGLNWAVGKLGDVGYDREKLEYGPAFVFGDDLVRLRRAARLPGPWNAFLRMVCPLALVVILGAILFGATIALAVVAHWVWVIFSDRMVP